MNSKGITEAASTVLIIILVVALAGIIFAVASGSLQHYFVKKSAYVATKAGVADSPISLLSGVPNQFPILQPLNGDPFSFPGQQQPQPSPYNVSLKILSPDGKTITPNARSLSGVLYGKTLYVYPDPNPGASECSYVIKDSLPNSPPPMTTGLWKLQMVDETNHVLIFTQNLNIKGTTSQPVSGGSIGSTGTMYRADCSVIPQTFFGNFPTAYNATMNMNTTRFDGNSYITMPNDPSLAFTGNMSLSMWFNPDTAGAFSTSGSDWHTLMGKGQIFPDGSEIDNYQLVQMGNKLYFEWNDPNGQHYNIMTTGTPVSANSWNYVTVSIQDGQIALYNNGVLQPINYYNSNVPTQNQMAAPPTVKLISTPNPVTVGKQNGNSPSNDFYFKGYMGAIDLYNRGLTQGEISANLANFRA
jgi:hypothetical protein